MMVDCQWTVVAAACGVLSVLQQAADDCAIVCVHVWCMCMPALSSPTLVSVSLWCMQLNSTRDVSSLQTGDGEGHVK